jgi:hypothetical protein
VVPTYPQRRAPALLDDRLDAGLRSLSLRRRCGSGVARLVRAVSPRAPSSLAAWRPRRHRNRGGLEKEADADERPYLALVSFVTRAGQLRFSIPLAVPYEAPPSDPERPTPLAEAHKVPAIGRTLRVVYDPRDATWADERLGLPGVALVATFGIVAILLFGALLISTIAVLPQAIEGPAMMHRTAP